VALRPPAADTRVRDALDRALELGELGVQVAAYSGDELVVDAWAGPVDGETLFPIFSVGKAFVATAIHLQAERGLLELDAPIAAYWPEYAANGKGAITIRHVLTHRAGVPQMPPELTPERLGDWEWITGWLAEQVTPLCPPGTRSQYHALSFGHLLAEVVRRTDPRRRPFGDFLSDELLGPLGVDDLWVGLPPEQEHRVAQLSWGDDPPSAPQVAPNPVRVASFPPAVAPVPEVFNLPAVHQACLPAASAIATARAVARFFALLARGGDDLLSRERLLELTTPRPNPYEVDEAIGMVPWLGIGGYWLGGPHPPADPVVGPGTHVLAHGGAGGSIAWADLDTGLAVAITHNRMFGALPPERHPFVELGAAVRALVEAPRSALRR
jgi:CubicO group peptidase (beta-lactamase class C family)